MVWGGETLTRASESGAVTLIPHHAVWQPGAGPCAPQPRWHEAGFPALVDGASNVWVGPGGNHLPGGQGRHQGHAPRNLVFSGPNSASTPPPRSKDGDEAFHVLSGQEGRTGIGRDAEQRAVGGKVLSKRDLNAVVRFRVARTRRKGSDLRGLKPPHAMIRSRYAAKTQASLVSCRQQRHDRDRAA